MCSKKAFSFSFNSPWHRSRFAQSERSRLQFSGLLKVIIPGTESLQATKDYHDDDDENNVCRLSKALSKGVDFWPTLSNGGRVGGKKK